jgi:hypothetical protein
LEGGEQKSREFWSGVIVATGFFRHRWIILIIIIIIIVIIQ